MLLTSTTTTKTLQELISSLDSRIIPESNKTRIVANNVQYGCYIKVVTGTLKIETLVGDIIDPSVGGINLEVDDTITFDISDLARVRVNGDATFSLLLS